MMLPQFVEQFFHLIGARCEPRTDGLRVELTREQLQRLEGRPRWGWSAPGDELTVLYFTFAAGQPSEERAQQSDDVQPEFIGPGSFRWRQIVDAALRLWGLSRVFVRPAGARVSLWRPHLVFHFALTYVAGAARQRTMSVSVNLVTGAVDNFGGLSSGADVRQDGDGTPAETPRLSVGDAHERAVSYLCDVLSGEDSQWALDHQAWIDEQLEQLQTYVRRAELEESAEPLAVVRAARLAELRHMLQSHVQVRAAAATVLYVPAGESESV